MKNIVLLLFLFLSPSVCYSQTSLKVSPINSDIMGNSIRIDHRWEKKKHVFYTGLGYLINPGRKAKHHTAVYVHKAYARSFLQHAILNLGYERRIKFKGGNVVFYPFTEFAFAYTGLKNESYILRNAINDGYLVNAYNYIYDDVNVLWIANHTGVGAEIKITNNIGITQQVGLSPSFLLNRYKYHSNNTIETELNFDGVTVPFYNLALTYIIK